MSGTKKLLAALLVAVLSLTACAGLAETASDFAQKDPASYNATLTMMVHSTGQPNFMIQKFNEIYPNIKIELVEVTGAEQQERIMTTVAAGQDVPDLYTSRTQFVKAIVNGGDKYYTDLYALGNTQEWVSDIADYVVGVGTDADGKLRALSWQCPVGGIYYRRSLAQKYFGTDDPEQIKALFASPEKILETAQALKEKSDGACVLFGDASLNFMYLLLSQAGGYMQNNVLNTGDAVKQIFELTKTFYDNDYCLKIRNDSATLNAAVLNDGVFALALPTWGLNYNIMPNFPDQAGDWGIVEGPYTYTAGGTYIGISSTTKHMEEAYLFLQFIFSNEDFMYSYATDFGDYVSNKKIENKIGALTAEETKDYSTFQYLNGQNAYAYWNSQLEKGVDATAFSPYDEYFGNYMLAACVSYATGLQTLDEALATYKMDCQSYAPSINVE